MKWIVQRKYVVIDTAIVEAESKAEAIEKAGEGDLQLNSEIVKNYKVTAKQTDDSATLTNKTAYP